MSAEKRGWLPSSLSHIPYPIPVREDREIEWSRRPMNPLLDRG
jgi:hypothetical protein